MSIASDRVLNEFYFPVVERYARNVIKGEPPYWVGIRRCDKWGDQIHEIVAGKC